MRQGSVYFLIGKDLIAVVVLAILLMAVSFFFSWLFGLDYHPGVKKEGGEYHLRNGTTLYFQSEDEFDQLKKRYPSPAGVTIKFTNRMSLEKLLLWGILCCQMPMLGIAFYRLRSGSLSTKSHPKRIIGAGIATGLSMALLGYLYSEALKSLGLNTHPFWFDVLHSSAWVGIVIFIIFVAPIAEELFFRQHIFMALYAHGTRLKAYLVSAAIFALFHLNPIEIPIIFLFGLLLALSLERTGHVMAPIMAHALNNVIALYFLI